METIVTFLKEYEFVFALFLSAIAAIYAVMSYREVKDSDKKNIQRQIALKQAELKAVQSTMHYYTIEETRESITKIRTLQFEIEELKKQL
jgi:hypothetical protein